MAKNSGRKGYKVSASTTPNNEPLNSGSYNTEWFPTVAFAINVDLPDELFDKAATVIAELNISMKEAKVSGEILMPEGITVKQK